MDGFKHTLERFRPEAAYRQRQKTTGCAAALHQFPDAFAVLGKPPMKHHRSREGSAALLWRTLEASAQA